MKNRNHCTSKLIAMFLLAAAFWGSGELGARAANVTWTNAAGGDLSWGTIGNWTNAAGANAVPSASDFVFFTRAGTTNVLGTVNNIVDNNTTVVSLGYSCYLSTVNGILPNYHTTLINPGVTLTVNSNAPSGSVELKVAGPNVTPTSADQLTYVTILGTNGSTLSVGNLASPSYNPAGTGPDLWVSTLCNGQAGVNAVLDMSGLDNFTFAGSYAAIGSDSSSLYAMGTLMLAKTNFIKTLQPSSAALSFCGVLVGSARTSASSYEVGDLQLGQTNTIWTDIFQVAAGRRGEGYVEFQTNLLGSSPSLFMRGTNGSVRATTVKIGDASDENVSITGAGEANSLFGTVDFTGGTVDIMCSTLSVGRNQSFTASSTRFGGGNGTLTFTAGTIDATTLTLGSQAANNRGAAIGVVNVRTNSTLVLGTVTIGAKANNSSTATVTGTLNVTDGGKATVTGSITDGTTGTSAINVTTNSVLNIGGAVTVDTLTLDGGKLHFISGNSADISATSLLSFGPGGATIDTDNNTVTLASPIGNSGSGGLTRIGSGKLILAADNPYTGPTVVSNGTLRVSNTSGSATGSGSVTLTSTGILEGAGSIAGAVSVKGTVSPGTSPGTITLGSAIFDGATLNMELGGSTNIGSAINDLVAVTGALTLTNHTTVVVSPLAALSTSGPYTLMQYGSLAYGYASNLTITSSSPRYGFTVLDPASTAPYVQMIVASTLAGVPLWHGGAGGNAAVWDIFTSTNWLIAGSPDKYANGDPVAFDDTALTNKVALVGALTPASISMSNNTAAYGFGGTGSIAAGGALAMYGSGSLTLSNSAADNFTGGIDLEAGSLTLANQVGPSSLGSVTLNGSSLLTIANNAANTISSIALNGSAVAAFNQPTNVTLSAPLTGGGTFVKQGANVLTLSANNSSFTGPMQDNAGVLRVGGGQALNGSGVAVANNATLDVNGIATATHVLVTAQGSGVGGRGALDNGSATAQPQAFDNIALAGDTTIGATGARWDTLSTDAGNGSSFAGNNFNLTKVGTNDFWLGVSGDTGLGDVDIKEGLMGFEQGNLAANCTLGDNTKTITVRTNATLGFWQPNVAGDKQVALQDRASLMGGSAGLAEFGGSVSKLSLNGTNRVWFALGGGTANPRPAGNLQCDSEITGGGVLVLDRQLFGSVASVGTFTLAGSNTFTSPVIVNDGALRLANNLALNTSGTVVVKTNGVAGAGTGGTSPKVPHVEFSGGVTIPPGVTIHLNSASSNLVGTLDMRTALVVPSADANEFQGTLIPHGDGNILVTGGSAGSYLTLSGPITNTAFALPAGLAFNGAGSGKISGQVNINGEMEMNVGAAAVWTYSGAGNHYAFLAIETGTTALGADNGLSTTDPVQMILSGTLDLAGFSQTLPSLTNTATAKIGNSSTGTNSTLTINRNDIVSTIKGSILDTLGGGTMTVALIITNSTVQLDGNNTYTGPTLVQNLGNLRGTGSLLSPVSVQSGGTLSPGASIGTLRITNSLVLQSGSLSRFELDAGTLASDSVVGLTSVSYGGTLVVSNVSLTPLSGGQSFKLFDAASYTGSFAAVVPATPGSGMQWDTNNLAVDGTLKVAAPPSFSSITSVGGGNIQFAITGPVGSSYSLLFSTNVTVPVSSWQVLTSGTITSSPLTINDPAATNKARFYRIRIP